MSKFMYFKGIFQRNDISSNAKLVYLNLSMYGGTKGIAWPFIHTIARDCGLSERTVIKLLDELSQKGLVQKTRRSNSSSVYKLFPPILEKGCEKFSPGHEFISPRGEINSPHNVYNNINNIPLENNKRKILLKQLYLS